MGRWPAGPDLPPGRTLPEVWSARWSVHPLASVLVDGWDPTRVVDGAALAEGTARVAAALGVAGVRPGDRVLCSARAGLESVQVLLAVLRAGAVLVTVSPSATASELEHFVADCTPVLALTDADGRGRVPPGVPVLATVELIEQAAAPAAAPD